MKFATIRVKMDQKAGFLRPISSKITPVKGKERAKKREKNLMVAFLRALSICQNSATRSAIPVVTRISLLIKTIQPDPAIKS